MVRPWGNDLEDELGAIGRTILGMVPRPSKKWAQTRMDAILASWPNSINDMAHAVAELDSPPTVGCDMPVRLVIVIYASLKKRMERIISRMKHVILRRLRTKE